MRDVVGLYSKPPEGALVLSVAEKSQISGALDRTVAHSAIAAGDPTIGTD